jgi:hypothetical protein
MSRRTFALMNRRGTLTLAAAALLVFVVGCNRTPQRLPPEEARAKGDALLTEMSRNIAALQTFAFTADERRERIGQAGKKTTRDSTRHVVIRRPNAFAFTGKGEMGSVAGWYDGEHVTLISEDHKVWARGPMPPTLDESLDYLASEYHVELPTADLFYSSPYDALMTKDTTGGWVDVQKIGDLSCDHLVYQQAIVDWEIWLEPTRRLPCQLKIIYKLQPGQPATTVTYHSLEFPQVSNDTFAAKVPDGYQRIKIMRHATVEAPSVADTPGVAATSGAEKNKPK